MINKAILGALMSGTLATPEYYGVAWNESGDTYARRGLTLGQTTGVSLSDALLPIQALMRRCLLADNGTVNHYLSATDSTLLEDNSTPADLSGADGQVMVEIPKFYYRYDYTGTTHMWDVSVTEIAGFTVHPAFLSDAAELDHLYVGAYEAVLYDASESKYTNALSLSSTACVFDSAGKTITCTNKTAPFKHLVAGDKVTVGSTVSNNKVVTVVSATDTVMTVSEALTDETDVSGTYNIVLNAANDKLGSVSGFTPMTGNNALGTRAAFRAWAVKRGAGWSQVFSDVQHAIQILFLTEYASFYAQSVLGAGINVVASWSTYNSSNPISKTGNSNSIGNASGNTAGSTSAATEVTKYMSYRGIENWYGHIWKFIDGLNANEYVPYVCNNQANFADDTSANYTQVLDKDANAITLPDSATNNFISTFYPSGRLFLAATVGNLPTTKVTDYYSSTNGWAVLSVSGASAASAHCGGFYFSISNISTSKLASIGSRVCFRN